MAAVHVIGSCYCSANATSIGVLTPVLQDVGYKCAVTDINGKIIFRVKDTSTNFHVLLNPNGAPIVTFRTKRMSMHKRWQVFRGASIESKDLIFSVRESSMMDEDVDLHVYTAQNSDEYKCDYIVSSSFVFYAGNSKSNNHVIAKACRDHMVSLSPNVDAAFIVSLIMIKEGMYEQEAVNLPLTVLKVVAFASGISDS